MHDPFADIPTPAPEPAATPYPDDFDRGRWSPDPIGGTAADVLSNVEAEMGVLGDLLADNRLIDALADRCRGADFSVALYGRVFDKMLEQASAGRQVDAVTLAPFFAADPDWQAAYRVLSAASLNAGPVLRTKAHVEQIVMLANRRRLAQGMHDVATAARDLSVSQDELLARADAAAADMARDTTIVQAPVAQYARDVIESFGKPVIGVRCGIIGSLDDALGVLRPAELIVVGGRPGAGKTSLVTSYAIGAASRGHGVLIFSLEMGGGELTRRMLADMTFTPQQGVLYDHILNGTVRQSDMRAVCDAAARFEQIPLEINESSGMTLARIVRQARSHKRRLEARGEKLELVIVDYLQLMAHSRPGMSLYEHTSEVARGLKDFAKAERLAVMAAAQLSRTVEQREDKRPIPSDLRDSGEIEQAADAILFVYREEEYLRRAEPKEPGSSAHLEWQSQMEAVRNRIEFIVGKRRNGEKRNTVGLFFGNYSAVRGNDFYSLSDPGAHSR